MGRPGCCRWPTSRGKRNRIGIGLCGLLATADCLLGAGQRLRLPVPVLSAPLPGRVLISAGRPTQEDADCQSASILSACAISGISVARSGHALLVQIGADKSGSGCHNFDDAFRHGTRDPRIRSDLCRCVGTTHQSVARGHFNFLGIPRRCSISAGQFLQQCDASAELTKRLPVEKCDKHRYSTEFLRCPRENESRLFGGEDGR